MPHYAPDYFMSREIRIDLVGAGGNGSQMLTGLARLNHALTALGHPGLTVTTYDPDEVSEANMGRQLFSAADVGMNKAIILTHRINAFFGLDWKADPRRYNNESRFNSAPHMIIACVDSRASRKSLTKMGELTAHYLMDLGNRASDGQVVLGQLSKHRDKHPADHAPLPRVYDLMPELIDTSIPEDDTPSCGLAEALLKQELFVNQAIVTPALSILWELLRHGRITWHGAYVNLRSGKMQPIPVPEAA